MAPQSQKMPKTIRRKSPKRSGPRAANRRGQSLEGSLPLGPVPLRLRYSRWLLVISLHSRRSAASFSIRSGNSPCRFTVALAVRPNADFPGPDAFGALTPTVSGTCPRPLSIVVHASIYNCLGGDRELHVFAFLTGDRSVATQLGVDREVLRETSAERPVCDR